MQSELIRETPGAAGKSAIDLPEAVPFTDRSALHAWLDDGLRGGQRGRLLAEYPTALEQGQHFAVRAGEGFAAHAMAHVVEVEAAGRVISIGMIGLVYAHPAFRGRGLAARCVERCARFLEKRRVPLAALWSELHDYYARLGFHPAGREVQYELGPAQRNGMRREVDARIEVSAPGPSDWPALESLYAQKPAHCRRRPGDFARLAATPDCDVRVARLGTTPVGYAALGRGDDFGGVVHEWAGECDAVLACWLALLEDTETITVLAGPIDEPPAARLRAVGAGGRLGAFALVRLLDPIAAWQAIARDDPALTGWSLEAEPSARDATEGCVLRGREQAIPLSHTEALQLLLGPGRPPALKPLFPQTDPGPQLTALPCPLFVWGFDSI